MYCYSIHKLYFKTSNFLGPNCVTFTVGLLQREYPYNKDSHLSIFFTFTQLNLILKIRNLVEVTSTEGLTLLPSKLQLEA